MWVGEESLIWELAQSQCAPQRIGAVFSPSSAHSILLDHIIAKRPASDFPLAILLELRVKERRFVHAEFEMCFLQTVIIKQ